MVTIRGGMVASKFVLLAALALTTTAAYGDFDGLSNDELENILNAIDYAGGDYREAEPSQPDYNDYNDYAYPMSPDDEDYAAGSLPQEVPIQQRQQEILDHGTPISNANGIYIGTSGGTTKANPPKNSGAVLPAYCDPPNPCPIGYTAKDGCIEDFENTSEFSREYQARQNCLCDSEHMFHCPSPAQASPRDSDPSFLAGYPPSLTSELDKGSAAAALGQKLVAKKGLGF